jgi:hypothetical protein
MAKVKLAKGKRKTATARGGWGCIVMVTLVILLAVLFMVWVMISNGNPT